MWLLILIILSGPEKIERVDILKIMYGKQECFAEVQRAVEVGLPLHSSISCIKLTGVSNVEQK